MTLGSRELGGGSREGPERQGITIPYRGELREEAVRYHGNCHCGQLKSTEVK